MIKVARVLDVKAELGESPVWSVDDQTLLWVDVHGKTINRFDPATAQNTAWNMSVAPGAIALREGKGVVIAAGDGVYDLDLASGAIEKLADAPFNPIGFRFNDGKPDRQGRFWCGSFPHAYHKGGRIRNQGVMYKIQGPSIEAGFAPITIANGMAFSPDGKIMYRAESLDRIIYAFDYNCGTGEVSAQRVFARVPDEFGYPDGATIDSEGGYWTALPQGPKGGGVIRFSPDGKVDMHFDMPVLAPTMPAFGGADMSTLYITSAGYDFETRGVTKGEMSGDVFAVKTQFRGIPETKMPAWR
jgi:sugar lactone lactonase YvrE